MGLLNRKKASITGKPKVRNIKPEKARKVIRSFHTLRKNRSKLIRDLQNHIDVDEENYVNAIRRSGMQEVFNGDVTDDTPVSSLVSELGKIHRQMESQGGLELYQIASTLGQHSTRGGDSSKKLLEWLKELRQMQDHKGYRALEIGSLSSRNVISTCGLFDTVTRVDLHSQEPESIVECDFMEFPIPNDETNRYDIVSCSLVLNFVPTPTGRGDMLRRIRKFFRAQCRTPKYLFMVLPLPCIDNSRYLDNELLQAMMRTLGFTQVKYHDATKVAYWLREYIPVTGAKSDDYSHKREVRRGKTRNNFAILL